jgi:FMN phosphatase YigB (HAD superfamily)
VGIISNTGQLNRTEISSHLPIDFDWRLFENVLIVLSAEVGVEKPDPAIFKLALERGAVSANLCLFCTENLHHTLIAQSLGYKTARIESVQEKDLLTLADFFLDADLRQEPRGL